MNAGNWENVYDRWGQEIDFMSEKQVGDFGYNIEEDFVDVLELERYVESMLN